jgi:hypothetical protein
LIEVLHKQKEKNPSLFKEISDYSSRFADLADDFDTFKQEILEQMRIKHIKYVMFKKLQDKDFVKTKQPEAFIMEQMKKSYEQSIIDGEESLRRSDENYDYLKNLKAQDKEQYNRVKNSEDLEVLSKAQYQELRASIKAKKEAKAKLLKQGFSGLKNYVYL